MSYSSQGRTIYSLWVVSFRLDSEQLAIFKTVDLVQCMLKKKIWIWSSNYMILLLHKQWGVHAWIHYWNDPMTSYGLCLSPPVPHPCGCTAVVLLDHVCCCGCQELCSTASDHHSVGVYSTACKYNLCLYAVVVEETCKQMCGVCACGVCGVCACGVCGVCVWYVCWGRGLKCTATSGNYKVWQLSWKWSSLFHCPPIVPPTVSSYPQHYIYTVSRIWSCTYVLKLPRGPV